MKYQPDPRQPDRSGTAEHGHVREDSYLFDKFAAANILGAITRAFSSTISSRGQSYSNESRVSKCRFDGSEGKLSGKVYGNAPRPYDVVVGLGTNYTHITYTACTCPITYNCKHAAALLWTLYSSLQKDGLNNIGYASSLKTLPQKTSADKTHYPLPTDGSPQLNTALKDKLKALAIALKGDGTTDQSSSGAGKGAREKVMAYVLHTGDGRRLHVEMNVVHIKKDGSYGRSVTTEPWAMLERQDIELTIYDRHVAKICLGSYVDYGGHSHASLPGEQELYRMAIKNIMASGRVHWQKLDGPLLKIGPDRPGRLYWHEKVDGSFKLRVGDGEASQSVETWADSPFYVNTETREIGELIFDPPLSDEALREVQQLPAARPFELQSMRIYLDTIDPEGVIARPPGTIETEIRAVKPTPRLWLESKTIKNTGTGLVTAAAERMNIAVFSLDYPGTMSIEQPGRYYHEQDSNKMIVEIPDHSQEAKLRKRLAEIGFTQITDPEAFGLGNKAIYLRANDPVTWARFVDQEMPLLEQDGWDIQKDKSFDVKIIETDVNAQDWKVTINRSGISWFDIELGIDIEGLRVSLMPFLRKAIKSLGYDADINSLQTLNCGGRFLCPMPDGRVLALPFERIRELLCVLLEVFGNGDDEDDYTEKKYLKATLAKVIDLLRRETMQKLHIIGAARLQEIAERLRNFGGVEKIKIPSDFDAILRDYQKDGLHWMQFLREFNLGGILADDMGLGKTVQALCHIWVEKKENRLKQPFLVVCPTSVLPNWVSEARRFTPKLKIAAVQGPDRERHFAKLQNYDLILTSYPLLARDLQHYSPIEFHGIFLDEAQAVKNAQTKTRECVAKLRAGHRVCLTGTPVQNNLGDLWSLLDLTMPSILGTPKQFAKHFRTPIEKRGDEKKKKQLARLISPFLLRRTKETVALELPPKTIMYRTVELEGDQRDLYETVRAAMVAKVQAAIMQKGLDKSQIIILVALLRLRQVCCDPRIVGIDAARDICTSVKMDTFMELLLPLVEEGRRILIFSQFTSMLDLIAAKIRDHQIDYVELRGDTKDRKTPVDDFQTGRVPVFLISLKAGGTGLNLTAADTVIHYDPWWNPAVEDQATDRAYRIGQDKPVFVYKLIAADTVEDRMRDLQERKRELYQAVLDGKKNAAIAFTEEDLAILFRPLQKK